MLTLKKSYLLFLVVLFSALVGGASLFETIDAGCECECMWQAGSCGYSGGTESVACIPVSPPGATQETCAGFTGSCLGQKTRVACFWYH